MRLEAGKHGFLGMSVPEQYVGGGVRDFRYNVALTEETVAGRYSGLGFPLHNDVMAPYLDLTNDEQRNRWLHGFVSGELISAISMTEPGTGSDLQGINPRAIRDGQSWILNGSKTFITNGINADLVIVVARTDPEKGAQGFSLFMVEPGMPGFDRGRNLDKIGPICPGRSRAQLHRRASAGGKPARRARMEFMHLMQNLPQMSVALMADASMENCLAMTIQYCRDRKSFGKSIGSFQDSRFVLAEPATETTAVRFLVDRFIDLINSKQLTPQDAALAKWRTTEAQVRLIDRCLQLHIG